MTDNKKNGRRPDFECDHRCGYRSRTDAFICRTVRQTIFPIWG